MAEETPKPTDGQVESQTPATSAPTNAAPAPAAPADPSAPAAPAEHASSAAPSATAAPSMMDIIAMQKQKLKERLAKEQKPAADAASSPADHAAPATSADAGTSIPAGVKIPAAARVAAPSAASAPSTTALGAAGSDDASRRNRLIKRIITVNAALVLVVLGVMVWQYGWRFWAPRPPADTPDEQALATQPASQPVAAASQTPATAIAQPAPEQPNQPTVPAAQVMSWAEAEQAYNRGDFARAIIGYRYLLALARNVPAEALTADYLSFREAMCRHQIGQTLGAQETLRWLTQRPSPLLRAVAWYQLAMIDVQGGQYLQGRMKAYLAAGALGALPQTLELETDCDFLAARAITLQVLSLYGQQNSASWEGINWADPLLNLDPADLRAVLSAGSSRMSDAVLGPTMTGNQTQGRREWAVLANQAYVDELLNRIGSMSGLNVDWTGVSELARRRMVTVFGTSMTELRAAEVACGAAGLVARFTGQAIVVSDPVNVRTLADNRDLLVRETESCWRRFFLRLGGRNDRRVAAGQFALACVQEYAGDPLDAIKQYQLTAERYPQNRTAPESLLRCAALRMKMENYEGARTDLQAILDKYPDFQGQDQVALSLGYADLRAERIDQAVIDFRKLFYMNLSPASQAGAALGLGKCFFRRGEYTESADWIERYIGLAKSSDGLAEGYLLLGRCRATLGTATLAERAFSGAIRSKPTRTQHAEAVLGLAESLRAQGKLLNALNALNSLDVDTLSGQLLADYLTLAGRTLRGMNLPERASGLLTQYVARLTEPAQAAAVLAEIARAHSQVGDFRKSAAVLTDAMHRMPPGQDYQLTACELAELCLKLDQPAQAIALADGVIRAPYDQNIRKRAGTILGQAHLARQEYDQAVQAFSMVATKPDAGAEKTATSAKPVEGGKQ